MDSGATVISWGTMVRHGMDYTMDYTELMARRGYKTGSLFQRCEPRYGCPPPLEGPPHPVTGKPTKVRPKHDCKGRWFGTIEAGFTKDGTRRRITVSAAKKGVVTRRLRDKRLELEKAGAANTRRTITVARWSTEWLQAIETKVAPSSLTTDKAAMKWAVKTIGHIKLADLTPKHVRSVAAAIRSAGKSTSTALRYHGPLVRMLKAASVEGYNIPPNVLMAEPPTAAINDREAIPLPQALTIIRHLTRREDDKLLIPDSSRWSLAFLQGIRQAEALGLGWENIDLKRGQLTICWQAKSLKYRDRRDPSKGFVVPDGYDARHLVGATHLVRPKSAAGWRVMPLVDWAAAALAEWQEAAPDNPHGLVWPGRTNASGTWPRNPASDRDQWEAIQAASSVSHPTGRAYFVHEIRHTTATLLMELKVPESVRIAIMGHSKITTTRGYEHVDITQARAALSGVGKLLELG
jgi:integrase